MASVVILFGAACSQSRYEKQSEMPPDPGETLPEWAFDAPYYFHPPSDAVPKPAGPVVADYPTHYFVNCRVFPIDRPENEVLLDRAPRIAVWWTNTAGCLWNRAGCFGLGQSHFQFFAGDDGAYGIRFVGPGIRESLTEQTVPHRIYHVDTAPPYVMVRVGPEQPVYHPGEPVVVHWDVNDPNLDPESVRLNICWSWENPDMFELRRPDSGVEPQDVPPPPATRLWRPYQDDCAPSDAISYPIPSGIEGESFQFQIRAKDRAGN